MKFQTVEHKSQTCHLCGETWLTNLFMHAVTGGAGEMVCSACLRKTLHKLGVYGTPSKPRPV